MGFTLIQQHNALDRNGDLGIGLSQKWWGKGYGTEVMRWVTAYAFSGLGLHKVCLGVWCTNTRAIAMYERV